MDLKGYLKKQGIKSLPRPQANPLPLRPEILLHPNIPKPLHQVNPRSVLGDKWWNAERKRAYKSTNDHCLACGVHKNYATGRQWMEGHELYVIDYKAGTVTYVETVPLCHYCHNYIHDGRMQNLVSQGKFPAQKYVAIIRHGDAVLRKAKLSKLSHHQRESDIIDQMIEGDLPEWHEWRLILFDEQYPPKFKDYEEWKRAHDYVEDD